MPWSASPLNYREAGGRRRLACSIAQPEPSELEWEGDSIPRGFWPGEARQLGQLSSYRFSSAEIPECAEVECSGKGGMRVINCLNGAFVFAFRQIPLPCRVQASLVVSMLLSQHAGRLSGLAAYSWVIN